MLRACEALMPVTKAHDVAFIVNDRPDLAKRVHADGVHVGQEDASYAEAREAVGKNAIVGVCQTPFAANFSNNRRQPSVVYSSFTMHSPKTS